MNKVIELGRLTKDPELRYTSSNTAVATFTLAVNRPKQKDKEQEADFINMVAWGQLAETIKKYLTKGSQVAIFGRIQTRTYDDEKGVKHYITEVRAEQITFLDTKKQDNYDPRYIAGATPNVTQKTPQTDPFAEMGNQVKIDDFPIDEEDLPF